MGSAATNLRNLRTFLLVAQFDPKEIGARIQQARNEAGFTQAELSDMAEGFKQRALQGYESGTSIPFKHLREIGQLLNRETAWFLYGDPQQPVDRLAALEAAVAELPTQDDLQRGLDVLRAAIDARANPGTQPGTADEA